MNIISTTKLGEAYEQQLIKAYPTVTFSFYTSIEEIETFHDAEVIMTYGEDLTDRHLQLAPNLKWVMVLSAGVEMLPLKIFKSRGIMVTNVRGIHKKQMSEYAMSMLLGHYRNMFIFYEQQKEKVWNQQITTHEINHRKMTIIGAGAIGEELARLAQAFSIETTAVTYSGGERNFFDRSVTVKEIESALSDADFVVSILPSTNETRPFYEMKHFQMMKDSAVFLNIGRGDVVSSDVLLAALDEGEISHAILDVLPHEPLERAHPFWSHDKITLTPHISGKSAQYKSRALVIFKENLTSYLVNQTVKTNVVDLNRGY